MLSRLFGLLVFVASSGAVIFLSGGGATFIQRPVSAGYLILWVIWWIASILGRRPGVPSAYGERRWVLTTAGVVDILILTVASPWEYAHFAGPIPRDGVLA